MRGFRIFILLLLVGFLLQAQEKKPIEDAVSVPAATDKAKVELRTPSQKRLDDFRDDRDYNYERNPPPPENPLARFWYWISRKFNEFLQSGAYNDFWQYVILAAIGGLAIWLLYKSNFTGGLFGRKAQEDTLAYNRITENIHELDFNALVENAVQARNFRLAVRLYYLKALKQLTDKELIHWQPTKTNRMYVNELDKSSLKLGFERLTSQFEYIWYGEFSVSEANFRLLKDEFQDFSEKINV